MRLNSEYLWFNQTVPVLWSLPGSMVPEEIYLDMLGHGSSHGERFQVRMKERAADNLVETRI